MRLPRRTTAALAVVALVLIGLLAPAPPPAGASTFVPRRLVSAVGATPVVQPEQGDLARPDPQSVSGDGRHIAFVTRDGGAPQHVYVRDRRLGTSELITVAADGGRADGSSTSPSISADGRYVAFVSGASNLVPGDDFGRDVFVRDRRREITTRVSRRADGSATGSPFWVQISADGRTVVWVTAEGAFVRWLPVATITNPVRGTFLEVSLSGDGHHLAYVDHHGDRVIRRIRLGDGRTHVVSIGLDGRPRTGAYPTISHDGRSVAFTSWEPGLVAGVAGAGTFVRDVDAGTTEVWAEGVASSVTLAGNARTLTLTTTSRLTPDDTDSEPDVFATRPGGWARLLSGELPPSPRAGRPPWYAELSGDGRVATLVSAAVLPGSGPDLGPRRWAVGTGMGDVDANEPRASLLIGFRRLFDREPTAAELDVRLRQVGAMTHTTAEVLLDDLRRESFSGPRAGVVRLYRAYFLRDPDAAGYQYWVGQRRAGRTLDAISQAFAGTAEFRSLYGTLTNRQLVDRIYRNVLGRAPDAAGSDFWTAQLDSGARTRGQVMTGFSEAPENREATRNPVETIMYYESFTGRMPDGELMAELEGSWIAGLTMTDTIDRLWP